MPRIKLTLRYDGTEFHGWAKQPDFRTIQAELELALSKVLPGMWGRHISTIVGGRTDTGVHANAQVIHFDVDDSVLYDIVGKNSQNKKNARSYNAALQQILYKLSCVLPQDIVVYNISITHPDFSARFWAKKRVYKYRICDNHKSFNPNRNDIYFVKKQLDVRKMNCAVRNFNGLHDFATFSKPRDGATTVRNLQKFRFKRVRFGADAGLIVATLIADAFAYNMVRSLVSAAILVGSGKRDTKWMYNCLLAKKREGATGPISAEGLTLERIEYVKNPKQAIKREKMIKNRRI